MARKRGGRHALKGGAPRLLGNHQAVAGRYWYRECWDALEAELGPFTGLLRLEAGRVCVAWTRFRAATLALKAAEDTRANGVGRRPSIQQLERLARRQGLEDGSYSQARDKLFELAKDMGKGNDHSAGPTLAEIRRRYEAPA